MLPPPIESEQRPPKRRRAYRVPLGLPGARQDWRGGSAFSIGFHLLILLLIVSPFAVMSDVFEIAQGAGGPGPAGGGGGGTRGSGSMRAEALKFVRVAPPPPPVVAQVETPPVVPPPPILPPTPVPSITPEEPKLTMTVGVGGGTGSDGTTGSGPGSGGGVGTGVGTGRGAAVGSGTGGGDQPNYPPEPIEMFLPPLPVPGSVKGHRLIAEFDVDANGKVLSVNFNETRDRGYNNRLREVLKGYRFRAGHRPDGTPVRMKAQIVQDLY